VVAGRSTRSLGVMGSDAEILQAIDAAFGATPKPAHFTDFEHCEECADHDRLLVSRSRDTLQLSDVDNPGWDPLCFTKAEGIAYLLPTLARFALKRPNAEYEWYGDQLMFHLYSGFRDNRLYIWASAQQKRAIAQFVGHLIESRSELIDRCAGEDDFLRCYELWHDT